MKFTPDELVGTPRCGVPARKAGGTNVVNHALAPRLRRLTLLSVTATAQRAVPTE